MHASSLVSVLACCCALGCGAIVQPGLANAPVLDGQSPETRVHDAVANGHDSCERAGFPQGEVLRGHLPPCKRENLAKPVAFQPYPAFAGASFAVSYPLGFCPARNRSLASDRENGFAAFPLSAPPWPLTCDSRSGVDVPAASHSETP